METKTVLAILLIGSIGLNIYLYYYQDGDVLPDPECHITEGFAPPKEIGDDEARQFAEEFRNSRSGEDGTLGGIISRTALDEILCTEKCNAIAYTLSLDSSGSIGPAGNGVFIVLTGAHVVYEEDRITEISRLGTKNYIGGYWCPPSCTP